MKYSEVKEVVNLITDVDAALKGDGLSDELLKLVQGVTNRALIERRQNLIERLEKRTGLTIESEV